MSITIYDQRQVAKICSDVLLKHNFDPTFMETRMCGLTSSINLVNLLSSKQKYSLDDAPKILDVLLQYNNKKGLTRGKLVDPDEFRTFSPEGDMYHKAAACLFEANHLFWLPIMNPASYQQLINFLKKYNNISTLLSVKNKSKSGGHMVVLFKHTIYDPDPENTTQSHSTNTYLENYYQPWSSLFVSKTEIPARLLLENNIMPKPVFKTKEDIENNPPGTKPWPIFIPDIVVNQLKTI